MQYRKRDESLNGETVQVRTGCGDLYVIMNRDNEGKPFEVFMVMGKAGGCQASQMEAIGRLISLALRSGVEISDVVKQLKNIACSHVAFDNGRKIRSCADAVAQALERLNIIPENELEPTTVDNQVEENEEERNEGGDKGGGSIDVRERT